MLSSGYWARWRELKDVWTLEQEKSERKLLPKLSSLKRRRRSTALCLLAEVEAAKETAS